MKVSNLNDLARDLIESVQQMTAGKITPKELSAKRNAYETVMRIQEFRLAIITAMRELPDREMLKLPS